jgi:hypothetical protein
VGHSKGKINFREGPGSKYKIHSSIDQSNTLIILPGKPENGYNEIFDVESNIHGYAYASLLVITDTMNPQKQKFFSEEGENNNNTVEIDLVNRTKEKLFIWMNGIVYNLGPYEKKSLEFNNGDVKYFAAAKNIFPI